jgi:hypothetical protein
VARPADGAHEGAQAAQGVRRRCHPGAVRARDRISEVYIILYIILCIIGVIIL